MDASCKWISDLFANHDKSDVELHVEVVQEDHNFVVPGHSLVLRHASRVFDTMLEPGKFKEGSTGIANIKVYGNKVDAISFIKYIYTKKLQCLDTNSYIALMQTAHLYEVTELLQLCQKRIKADLTPYSVCNIYSALRNISQKKFRDLCEGMMLKFAFLVFGEKLHFVLTENDMHCLLASRELNVLNEEQALQAVWDWGHNKCILEKSTGTKELKDMVARLLPLIKWSNIADIKNKPLLFNLYTHCKENDKNSDQAFERAYKAHNSFVFLCFARALALYYNLEDTTSPAENVVLNDKTVLITFTSNDTLLLTGLKITFESSPKILENNPFQLFINTLMTKTIFCKAEVPKKVSHDSCSYVVYLVFLKPVLLKANMIHVISVSVKSGYCISAPKFIIKSSALESGILVPNDETRFSITREVVALDTLYYFLQR